MKFDVIRAWKDEAYRRSLSVEECSQLPENPAGEIELSEAELEAIYGGGSQDQGTPTIYIGGFGLCTFLACGMNGVVSYICNSAIGCSY